MPATSVGINLEVLRDMLRLDALARILVQHLWADPLHGVFLRDKEPQACRLRTVIRIFK